MRRLCASLVICLLTLSVHVPRAAAQRSEATLSEGEVEQLREAAYIANDRVLVFIQLINTRIKALEDLYAKPRRPGREQDTHDLMEQFTSLANELEDNLDDYSERHRDIRKALPKLLEASDRWGTAIRTPADNAAYNVSRKIALESLDDVRQQATQVLEEQKAWFAAHPPKKDENTDQAPR